MQINGNKAEYIRSFNRRVVLETVRVYGPLSRAEIARKTGLTPQTVASIATELEKAALVVTHGRRKSARGQPPIDLAINPEGGYTLGIQFNNRTLIGVASDLAGGIRTELHAAIAGDTSRAIIEQIKATVAELIRGGKIVRKRLLGLGVVMPGPFDIESHMSASPGAVTSVSTVRLAEQLRAELKLSVYVENDATAAALGERLHGAARPLRQFCYVFIGLGVGAGMIVDGLPYRGAWGNAGEFGHVLVEPGGRPCYCGNAGCLGQYASLDYALRLLRQASIHAELEDLEGFHARGEPILQAWLAQAAEKLLIGVNMLENLLDPETILLGGYLPENILDDLLARLTPHLMPSVSMRRDRSLPRLLKAGAGPNAAALGASALPLFQTVSPTPTVLFKGGRSLEA